MLVKGQHHVKDSSRDTEMEIVQSKDLKWLRVARGGDKVYKDECVYCFNCPVS